MMMKSLYTHQLKKVILWLLISLKFKKIRCGRQELNFYYKIYKVFFINILINYESTVLQKFWPVIT